MLPKSEKLAQCLQATQQFVVARVNRDPVFGEIAKELGKIAGFLNAGKLAIEIFSRFPNLAQALHNFFSTRQALPQFYKFKQFTLPTESELPQPNLPPALILQANSAVGQQQDRYELSTSQNILIGRDPQYDNDPRIVQIALPVYKKVSGLHAEIQPVINFDSPSPTWQICDRNSTNGTYINGQRVYGCKILQLGDRITLAYASSNEKCPEFLFECRNVLANSNSSPTQLVDCDLACLVIDPKQTLTNDEKQFIDKVSRTQISGLIIIADVSVVDKQSTQHINSNLATVNHWIKVQFPSLPFELRQLLLQPFYPDNTNTSVDPSVQQGFEKFCEPLVIIGKKKSTDILLKRLTPQLLSQIARIEQIINAQEKTLKMEIQQTEEKLRGRAVDEWREQVRKAFKKVGEDREEFFRQAKTELSRSKADLINGFTQRSLLYKIKLFIDDLNPVVTRQKGQVCIQLQSKSNVDGHQVIIRFCQAELTKWATEEWWRFCNSYGESGLNGLHQRSYITLNNCIPSLTLSNSFSRPSQTFDFQKILQDSFVEMQGDASFYEESLNKELFGIGMQGAIAAGIYLVNPVSAAVQGGRVASSLVGLVGRTLSRPQLQKLKLEELTAKLRQTGCNYYQSLAKYLVERLVQDIGVASETEERLFKKTLESVDEQFTNYLAELKTCADGYRVRQNNLNQEKAALEKLKHI